MKPYPYLVRLRTPVFTIMLKRYSVEIFHKMFQCHSQKKVNDKHFRLFYIFRVDSERLKRYADETSTGKGLSKEKYSIIAVVETRYNKWHRCHISQKGGYLVYVHQVLLHGAVQHWPCEGLSSFYTCLSFLLPIRFRVTITLYINVYIKTSSAMNGLSCRQFLFIHIANSLSKQFKKFN